MEIDPEKFITSPFTAGLIGSLITAFKFTPGAKWWEKVVNVLAGWAAAGFVTPPLVDWLHHSPPEGYVSGAAFLVGMLGMSLVAAAIDWLKSGKLGETISSWTIRR